MNLHSMRNLFDGLSKIHGMGEVHGDIWKSNIMRRGQEFVFIDIGGLVLGGGEAPAEFSPVNLYARSMLRDFKPDKYEHWWAFFSTFFDLACKGSSAARMDMFNSFARMDMFNSLIDKTGDLSEFLQLATEQQDILSGSCRNEGGDLSDVFQISIQALKLMTDEKTVESIYPNLKKDGKRDIINEVELSKLVGKLNNLLH